MVIQLTTPLAANSNSIYHLHVCCYIMRQGVSCISEDFRLQRWTTRHARKCHAYIHLHACGMIRVLPDAISLQGELRSVQTDLIVSFHERDDTVCGSMYIRGKGCFCQL